MWCVHLSVSWSEVKAGLKKDFWMFRVGSEDLLTWIVEISSYKKIGFIWVYLIFLTQSRLRVLLQNYSMIITT